MSVHLSVSALTAEPFDLRPRLCRVQQRVKKSHYQSVEFVRVSNSHADVVDWLLFYHRIESEGCRLIMVPIDILFW